ncbi:hypothetical protein GZH46_00387, partial [Fragariocoptes setiger]
MIHSPDHNAHRTSRRVILLDHDDSVRFSMNDFCLICAMKLWAKHDRNPEAQTNKLFSIQVLEHLLKKNNLVARVFIQEGIPFCEYILSLLSEQTIGRFNNQFARSSASCLSFLVKRFGEQRFYQYTYNLLQNILVQKGSISEVVHGFEVFEGLMRIDHETIKKFSSNGELMHLALSCYDVDTEDVSSVISSLMLHIFSNEETSMSFVLAYPELFNLTIITVMRVVTNISGNSHRIKAIMLLLKLSCIPGATDIILFDLVRFEKLFKRCLERSNELSSIYILELILIIIQKSKDRFLEIVETLKLVDGIISYLNFSPGRALTSNILKVLSGLLIGSNINIEDPFKVSSTLLALIEKNIELETDFASDMMCYSTLTLVEIVFKNNIRTVYQEVFFYNAIAFLGKLLEANQELGPILNRLFVLIMRPNCVLRPAPMSTIWRHTKRTMELCETHVRCIKSSTNIPHTSCNFLASAFQVAKSYVELVDSLTPDQISEITYQVEPNFSATHIRKKEFYIGRLVCLKFAQEVASRSAISLMRRENFTFESSLCNLIQALFDFLSTLLGPSRFFPKDVRKALLNDLLDMDILTFFHELCRYNQWQSIQSSIRKCAYWLLLLLMHFEELNSPPDESSTNPEVIL